MTSNNTQIDLTGQVIVLTGGTRGIGRALAEHLAAAGADLAVLARNQDDLTRLHGELSSPERISTHAVDIADTQAIAPVFDEVLRQHGRIDGLVNCAGINKVAPTIDYPLEQARQIFDVNVLGLLACCQLAARAMPDGGSIVNIASLSSFVGQPERTAYVGSKAAVIGMTKSMAVEWGPLGIRVNAVAPGYIETDLTRGIMASNPQYRDLVEARTPLRRFGQPDDLAGAVLFLLSSHSAFVSGAHICVDGGWLANGFMK
ncbi:MAG: SDR family NAD(P)-dependent oxidoreductase [Beutenbergiaceae bacterium]